VTAFTVSYLSICSAAQGGVEVEPTFVAVRSRKAPGLDRGASQI